MKPSELRKWMAINEKSPTDVASLTRVALTTVQRFLSGEIKNPQPRTLEAFKNLLAGKEAPDPLTGF
jgi:hypothetical protein